MKRAKNKVVMSAVKLLLLAGLVGSLAVAPVGAASMPLALDLKPGFVPTPLQLSTNRWLAFIGSSGCEIGPINGLQPIYVARFKAGLLPGDPLAPGDVIVAINGEPLLADPIFTLRKSVAAARDKLELVSITRWRNGAIATMTINPIPQPPDLTQGGRPEVGCSDLNLGPTGCRGWIFWGQDHTFLSRQILVTAVAAGSPAAGILRTNDVILGVNGALFTNDARRSFGQAITMAEASNGVLRLLRWRAGLSTNVELQLAVLGQYGTTAPYGCAKSQAIFEQGCKLIAKQGLLEADIPMDFNALALLASGKAEYRPMLADYARKVAVSLTYSPGACLWSYAYGNLFLAEYVLATGDQAMLPELKRISLETAKAACMNGMWGHHPTMPDGHSEGYGGMNQVGLPMTLALVLARKAGVDDPGVNQAICNSIRLLHWFAGKGSVAYGDHGAGASHENNGMCSSSAVLWDLLGDREATDFFSRMALAAYDEREGGHCGSFWNLLWALPGASRCGPAATGAYLQETAWFYDLARGWDGSFVYQHGEDDAHKYDGWDSTGAYLLSYGLPLKSLYIIGRTPTAMPLLASHEVQDVIAAGRDVYPGNIKNGYNFYTTDKLLAGLSSWSPAVRERSALALGKREGDFVPALLKLLAGSDCYGRYGACAALGCLGARGDAAAPQLRALLKDADPWAETLACNALACLGPAVRTSSIDDLLAMAARKDPADPRGMVQRAVAPALFAPPPGSHEPSILAKSLDGVDRKLLYPALCALLRNEDSAPRGAVSACLPNLTDHDLAVLLPEIVEAVKTKAPTDEMFAEGIRLAGLDLLSRRQIREGMELCVSTLEMRWGVNGGKRLEYLKRYGVHAQAYVPLLRKECTEWKWQPGLKAIAEIEASTNAPTLVSLQEFVAQAQASKQ